MLTGLPLLPVQPFLGAGALDAARLVLVGAPLDATVTGRPGSRHGPPRIREVSEYLEEYSPKLDRTLSEARFHDAGDLNLPLTRVGEALRLIASAADAIAGAGRIPLVIGGEHLVTLGPVRALAARHPNLALLHFDAHLDLRDDWMGERDNHATVVRRCVELLQPGSVYQFGVRSGAKEEYLYAATNTTLYPDDIVDGVTRVRAALDGRPVYVTVDIDVLDPAFAPGTGTPEPGGVSSNELLAALACLKGLNVVGMDLVEVAPAYDPTERTAYVAAKALREAILVLA